MWSDVQVPLSSLANETEKSLSAHALTWKTGLRQTSLSGRYLLDHSHEVRLSTMKVGHCDEKDR